MSIQYHLPIGARNPERCLRPAGCTLGVHVATAEEADQLRPRRDGAINGLGPSWTKADLPRLRESLRTGVPVLNI
jgi:hypothetical protein